MAKIMVVDDAFIARNNLKKILERFGHKVIAEASSGLQAVKLYEKYVPDLVTMDITMPGMTGIEAADKLVTQYPKARVVMVTAASQKKSVYMAIEAGAKHYIVKPFCEKVVIDVIEKVLRDTGYSENEYKQDAGTEDLVGTEEVKVDINDPKFKDNELKSKIDALLFD